VDAVRRAYPPLGEDDARAAVHAVFGLLNSTPHLAGALTGRPTTGALLHRLARGAFAAAPPDVPTAP
jgi:hypothetical protein